MKGQYRVHILILLVCLTGCCSAEQKWSEKDIGEYSKKFWLSSSVIQFFRINYLNE